MNLMSRPPLFVLGAVLAGMAFQAQAQHARSIVIDPSAAAIVASTRAGAAASPGSNRSMAEQLIKDGAVVRQDGRRTEVYVPNNVRTCSANLSIGSLNANAGYGQQIDLRVITLGTIVQTNDC